MKRNRIAILLACAMSISMLAGCGSKEPEAQTGAPEESGEPEGTGETQAPEEESAPAEKAVTLNIFAAASMTETLEEIGLMYAEEAPEVELVFNFDSSGTLKTQIQEGAECDLFISAAQKQMNQLDLAADPAVNEEGLDYVLEGSRVDLLENKVVLAVPDGNPAGIESFEDPFD